MIMIVATLINDSGSYNYLVGSLLISYYKLAIVNTMTYEYGHGYQYHNDNLSMAIVTMMITITVMLMLLLVIIINSYFMLLVHFINDFLMTYTLY